jgi:hypothetical protein
MAFNPADFPKPSLGFLTGFVDTKGMQIAQNASFQRLIVLASAAIPG